MPLRQSARTSCRGFPLGLLGFALEIALVLLLSALPYGATAHAQPKAQAGVLDLSGHDPASEIIPLSGEWEFYWNRLLEPRDFRDALAPEPDAYVRVPGSWKGYTIGGDKLGGLGYGTYRLVLRLPEGRNSAGAPAPFALYIPWVFTAYTLWIDGALAASNGTVSASPAEGQPEFLPVTVPFNPAAERVEIIVQVSNYHHRNGGIWNSPLLGSHERIARRLALREAIDMFLIGAILAMALYHLAVYILFRDRRAPVYLGATCFLVAARTMVTSEHILDQLTGGLPWAIGLRIEYATGYAFIAVYTGFLRSIFPDEMPRSAEATARLIAGLGAGVAFFAPAYVSSLFIPYFMLTLGLFMLFSLGVLALAVRRKREGARHTFWGGIAFVAAIFHDFFHYNLLGLDMDMIPLGLFALVIFHALALGERFALGYRREMALAHENADLLVILRSQLEEVRRSRRILAAADEELRKNIAERLHGRVQTRLLAVWHRLGMLKEALAQGAFPAGAIDELRREIDEIREVEIRQVSHLLHPSIVRVGLLPAVDFLVRQYQDSFIVRLHVDDQVKSWDDPVQNRIPEPVRLVAYRVVEDALANVRAHAQARVATIRIGVGPGGRSLRIEVADDGRGFNRERIEPKLGLNAIAARVSTVGGSWELESQPGAGTVLSAELPIDPAAAESPVRDPVTSLLSRESFESVAESVLDQCKRSKTPAGVIYVALGGIRAAYRNGDAEQVDKALRALADAVRHAIPTAAMAFRYHDEAIVVLLPEAGEDAVRKIESQVGSTIGEALGKASGGADEAGATSKAGARAPFSVNVGSALYPADGARGPELVEFAARRARQGPAVRMHA